MNVKNLVQWRLLAAEDFVLRHALSAMADYFTYIRSVAIVTVLCFVLTSIIGPTVAQAVETARENREYGQVFDDFVLPYTVGRITDGRVFESSRVVIKIQALHCHAEVQKNINRILTLIDEKNAISKVFLEGAIGPVDTSWAKSIKEPKLKDAVITSLVDAGKLTGVEYYSIANEKDDLIYGLEDSEIYTENISRLNKILENKLKVDDVLDGIKA